MSGVGGGKKRKIEEQERIDWILARVQIGMSKSEIMRQTEARYGLSTTQSRVWYIKAADSLIIATAKAVKS